MELNQQQLQELSTEKLKRVIPLYKRTFNSEQGLGVVEDLEDKFFNGVKWYPGMTALDMAFTEGQRSVVAMIRDFANKPLEDLIKGVNDA